MTRSRLSIVALIAFALPAVVQGASPRGPRCSDDCASGGGNILELITKDVCVMPGDTIEIQLYQRALCQEVRGYQVFLQFDPACMTITESQIVFTNDPYAIHVFGPLQDLPNGRIDLFVGIDDFNGQPPTQADALLVTFTFKGESKCNCTNLVFRVNDPPTLFTGLDGSGIVPCTQEGDCICIDDIPPDIICPPGGTFECDEDNIVPTPTNLQEFLDAGGSVSDNCTAYPVEVSCEDVITPGMCEDEFTVERTCTATDCAGNTSECTTVFDVVDTTPPVITCPDDVTVECDQCTDPPCTGTATASDNCDPNPTVSYSDSVTPGSCLQKWTITRTWTATDRCGNTGSCDQIITVLDTTAPAISCPGDVTVECDECTDPSCTGTATASDNCDPNPTVSYSDEVTPGNCAEKWTIRRTWTATDCNGNSSSCDQIITVVDRIAPQITCPGNVTIECDESTDPSNTGTATASDNCDPAPTVTYSDSVTPGSCLQKWTITRTWTATDCNGNSSSCDQIITVLDRTAPEITCPGDVTVECDESTDPSNTGTPTSSDNCDPAPVCSYSDSVTPGSCPEKSTIERTWTCTDCNGNSNSCVQTITVVDTTAPAIDCPPDVTIECDESTDPSNTGTATASDNCDPNPMLSYSDVVIPGNCPEKSTIERTWTATDCNGNSDSCTQIITVLDRTAPDITCPDDVTIDCNECTDPSCTGTATASDNCDPQPTVTYSDVVIPGSCPEKSSIERTWTATDCNGNSSSCTQIITVVDNTAPQITCPSDVTIECDECVDPSCTGTATASDNCDPAPTITYSDSVTPGSCLQKWTITRTWTATDCNGNSSSCDQIITVLDRTAPQITCPGDVTVECDESTDPSNTGTATASDNCDPNPTVTYSDSVAPGRCPEKWVITRTWTATDCNGNSSSCDQAITVVDSTAPQITCPGDVTVECNESTDPSNTGTATASDNCDPNPTVSYSDEVTPGNCPEKRTITRTWTATDCNDNSSSCDQIITVVDNTAPTISCPNDVTIDCDESTDPSNTGMATASDNCDPSPKVTYSDVVIPGSCPEKSTIERTWCTWDCNDNTSCCVQIITVVDTTAPGIDCPPDVTVECANQTDPSNTGTATSSDNCDPNPVCTYSDVITPGTCPNDFVIERTWTCTDCNGNSSSCMQTITVFDNVDPELSCPGSISVECIEDVPPAPANLAEFEALGGSASDNCKVVTVVCKDVSDGNTCPELITRTCRAEDECGNFVTCKQSITVDDHTPPVFTAGCPLPPITVVPDAGRCDADVVIVPPEITDNCDCGVTLMVVRSDGEPIDCGSRSNTCSTPPFPPGNTIITFIAKDCCGNANACTQTVTVEDYNIVRADVDIGPGVMVSPRKLCITFELYDCSGGPDPLAIVAEEMDFITNNDDDPPGSGNNIYRSSSTIDLEVPCSEPQYTCMTAQDLLHTLPSTSELTTEVVDINGQNVLIYRAAYVGPRNTPYVPTDPENFDPTGIGHWLVLGNLDSPLPPAGGSDPNDFIDIRDFGVFSAEFFVTYGSGETNCTTPWPHADLNGNRVVGATPHDFSIWVTNLNFKRETVCCVPPLRDDDSGGPVWRISVRELRDAGYPRPAMADLNHDGWVDLADVEAFFQGTRPERPRPELRPVPLLPGKSR